MIRFGKENSTFMKDIVYQSLGRKSHDLIAGPRPGADNAVISLGGRRVLILTVDPVSIIPALGTTLSAWLSVHLIASDYATSGLRPEYATFSFNFPPNMGRKARGEFVRAIGRECENLRVTVAAGHTGSYPGAEYSVVGAGTMFGFARADGYVETSMARTGDAVLMTKSAAIEAAAYLALSFPRFTKNKVGGFAVSWAKATIKQCSTVADALSAAKVGLGREGVTSMHDATEGGVLGALAEMAQASRNAFVVDEAKIPVLEGVKAVCSAFGIDPLTSSSEGALLITCNPNAVGSLMKRLKNSRLEVRQIGRVREGRGLFVSREGGTPTLVRLPRDGYWGAYARSVAQGLD